MSQSAASTSHNNELVNRFINIRSESLNIIASLSAEDCQLQAMADASPIKWHLAHTTWF